MDVGLEGCGEVPGAEDDGDGDGDGGGVLRCMVLQIKVLENHQNGKDTHVRGVQIFARDERAVRGGGATAIDKERRVVSSEVKSSPIKKNGHQESKRERRGVFDLGGLSESSWMREPELR